MEISKRYDEKELEIESNERNGEERERKVFYGGNGEILGIY